MSDNYERGFRYTRGNAGQTQVRTTKGGPCAIEGCPLPLYCVGLCRRHYMNWRYYFKKGDFSTVEEYVAALNKHLDKVDEGVQLELFPELSQATQDHPGTSHLGPRYQLPTPSRGVKS